MFHASFQIKLTFDSLFQASGFLRIQDVVIVTSFPPPWHNHISSANLSSFYMLDCKRIEMTLSLSLSLSLYLSLLSLSSQHISASIHLRKESAEDASYSDSWGRFFSAQKQLEMKRFSSPFSGTRTCVTIRKSANVNCFPMGREKINFQRV